MQLLQASAPRRSGIAAVQVAAGQLIVALAGTHLPELRDHCSGRLRANREEQSKKREEHTQSKSITQTSLCRRPVYAVDQSMPQTSLLLLGILRG